MNVIHHLFEKFLSEEKWTTAAVVLLSTFVTFFQINAISIITANIIEGIQKKDINIATKYYKMFVLISALYIFVFYLYKYFQNKLFTKVSSWMRNELFKIILKYNNEEYSGINFSTLASPISKICSSSYDIFYNILTHMIPNFSFLFVISLYFLYKSPIFGSSFFICNIFIMMYLYSNWSEISEQKDIFEGTYSNNEKYLVDMLNNVDRIISRGKVDDEINNYSTRTNDGFKHAYNFYNNVEKHVLIMTVMVYIIIFLSLGYLIHLFFEKELDTKTFVAFFTIILLYRDKIGSCIEYTTDYVEFIGRSNFVINEFTQLIGSYKDLENITYQEKVLNFTSIKFKDVSFKYASSDHYLYENLNVDIQTDNKIIGITGLSGKGKSTFVKMILKMYRPNEGDIYIDDVNIKDIDPNYIRKNITYINQNSKLFDKKLVENIMYACSETEKCTSNLQEIMKYPKIKELYKNIDIYNKESGTGGEKLSGGQRQVTNIISGLINPSKILILDEPTNALDPELKKEIISLIKHYKQFKNCVIIITHDSDVHPLFSETLKI
jgi:ABC-type multidrug transport system fused ATPase/permease subunit